MNIARTTLSSKLLTHHKEHFAKLAVEAILRLKSSGNLEAIKIIKKLGSGMKDSYLEEGMFGGVVMNGVFRSTVALCGHTGPTSHWVEAG